MLLFPNPRRLQIEMSGILRVKTEKMSLEAEELRNLSEKAAEIAETISDCRNKLKLADHSDVFLRQNLNSLRRQLLSQAAELGDLSQTLNAVIQMYIDCENGLIGKTDGATATGLEGHSEESEEVAEDYTTFLSSASDADYARMCYMSSLARSADGDPRENFYNLMREAGLLPEGISMSQITAYDNIDGFQAFIISDGETAMVLFAGTNELTDVVSDVALTFGIPSTQAMQARLLVNMLSKTHDNIVVTGHSLGGYLATDATLSCETVSRCVAFDPPGRAFGEVHDRYNEKQVSKIATYNAKGSFIHLPGHAMGDTELIEVEEKWNWVIDRNHGIKEISEAMDRREAAQTGGFR